MGQDPGEVRRDVEVARDQLGETVEAIAYRVNAPKRAKRRAVDAWSRFTHRVHLKRARAGG
jgi:Protein of unknown function (DUF3618)